MTQDDAKAFGIEIPKSPEVKDEFEIWECNWETVMMFLYMQTQWEVSMSGYVGLKYEVLLICLLYTSPSPRDATLSRMPSSA